MSGYEDIIGLKYEKSKKHPHMSRYNRAAQFSPFAALTGYEEQIDEQGRLTYDMLFLEEDKKQELDQKLADIMQREEKRIKVTYFVPDSNKSGGDYITYNGEIKKLDEITKCLIMKDETVIHIEDIKEIE